MKKVIAIVLVWAAAIGSGYSDNCYVTNSGTTQAIPVSQTILPAGVTSVTSSSGNVANAVATATLPAVSGKTNYITGFQVTSAGATGPLAVSVTVTGLIGGTATYTFVHGTVPAFTSLIVPFDRPIPASATNTAITVTLPASGAGGLNAAANVQGFLQ